MQKLTKTKIKNINLEEDDLKEILEENKIAFNDQSFKLFFSFFNNENKFDHKA